MLEYVKINPHVAATAGMFPIPISRIASANVVTPILSVESTPVEYPTTLLFENLSPEDRESREKGLALLAHIEHRVETDEEFRRWIQDGIDQADAGQLFAFNENMWEN